MPPSIRSCRLDLPVGEGPLDAIGGITIEAPEYNLHLLGGASIEGPGGRLTASAPGRNLLALLAVLSTTSHRTLPRETILALLWPESDSRSARHSLNVTVYEIRKAMGQESIVTDNDVLVLDPTVLGTDVERFEAAVEAENWGDAAERYHGPFLDGFRYDGSEPFERWLQSERSRLERLYRRVLLGLAEETVEPGVAVGRWREVHEADPADSRATMGLMRALGATGRRAEALDLAHAHRILLFDEYGADPDPDVEDLADHLREAPSRRLRSTPPGAPDASRSLPSNRWWGLVGATTLVLAALIAAAQDNEAPIPQSNRILIAGFENSSGDPELDDLGPMATDWIAQELSKTGLVLPILPVDTERPDRVADRMKAAERAGAGLVVLGRYVVEDDSIAATGSIVRVPSGEIVRSIDRVTSPRGDPKRLVEMLRQRVTGSLATLMDDRLSPFVSAGASQPPSYEAYREFAEGIEHRRKNEHRAAAIAFHRAAARDPSFTLPLVYALLSHETAIYYPDPTRRDARQAEMADSVRQYLRARRDSLPPWEAAWIDYRDERDPNALRRITDMTPEPPWLLLLARYDLVKARPTAALKTLARLEGEDPEADWNRKYLELRMDALHIAEKHTVEYEVVREYLRRYPPTRPLPPRTYPPEIYEIRALAALGRTDEMERRVEELMGRASDPYEVNLPLMEMEIHGHGDHPVADRLRTWFLERALASERADDPEELWRWAVAMGLWRLGRLDEARAQYEQLLERAAPTSDNAFIFLGALGQIAAVEGNRSRARQYDARLRDVDLKRFPERSVAYLVQIQRINIAIALGERQRAIRMLGELVRDGFPLYANGHPEMFQLRWLELSDEPAYRALVRPL